MPLYEMIVLCRIGESQAIANLIKSLVIAVYQEGGVIRKVSSLGDRISDKSYRAKDGSSNTIIRYLSVHFDANPQSKIVAEKVARNSTEVVTLFTHKMKESNYYKEIFNKDAWAEVSVETENLEYKDEMTNILANAKIDLGNEYFEKFDKVKNRLI